METWGFFAADTGAELTRGWQGSEDAAHEHAQKLANELDRPIEFAREPNLSDGVTVEPSED